eukprot:s3284_g1.t1
MHGDDDADGDAMLMVMTRKVMVWIRVMMVIMVVMVRLMLMRLEVMVMVMIKMMSGSHAAAQDSAREQASQQVLTFVRFAVMDLRQQVQAGQEMIKSELDTIKEFVLEAENSLNERLCRLSGESAPPKKTVPVKKPAPKGAASPPSPAAEKKPAQTPASSAPKRVASAKSVTSESPATTSGAKGKADSRLDADAPLQQLMKINRELQQGMKKLLDAHSLDVQSTMASRRNTFEFEKEVLRQESSGLVKPTVSMRSSGAEIEKDPPAPPEGVSENGSGDVGLAPKPASPGLRQLELSSMQQSSESAGQEAAPRRRDAQPWAQELPGARE